MMTPDEHAERVVKDLAIEIHRLLSARYPTLGKDPVMTAHIVHALVHLAMGHVCVGFHHPERHIRNLLEEIESKIPSMIAAVPRRDGQ